ncbi:MAG: glycosyltransferase family 4 protein [Candidatus Omnitrophica bacterium]|nr:glycosyltransferase family 4 protein [Candidatus Omnitrophota bacterium]
MDKKPKILICGVLPPPLFGHSALYEILMGSSFVKEFPISFLNLKFWSYQQHKKITIQKISKLILYFGDYFLRIVIFRPKYILYNMSWDKMPFLKDFLFCATGRILGCQVVIHDMGQYAQEMYQSSGRGYRFLMRWLLKRTSACIVLGGKTYQSYLGLIDPQKVIAVPGSVEDTIDVARYLEKSKDPEQPLKILYFSYLSQSKGVHVAFKAAARILEKNRHVKFTFVGPFESPEIERDFLDLQKKYPSQIEYAGYVQSLEERVRLYRSADIFIFPTLRDVFGLVLLHAMAESLPIVASDEGNVSEIIEEGRSGFLISKGNDMQLAEKIQILIDNPALRKTMGEWNRAKYLKMYRPEHYGQRMSQAFLRIEQGNENSKHG